MTEGQNSCRRFNYNISVGRCTGSQLKEGCEILEMVEKVRWEQLHESVMSQLYSGTRLVLAFQ